MRRAAFVVLALVVGCQQQTEQATEQMEQMGEQAGDTGLLSPFVAMWGANIVLGCSKMFPDFVYAWPTAEFAPTGPESVVHAVFLGAGYELGALGIHRLLNFLAGYITNRSPG